jgi:hypothetical protein
MAYRTNPDEKVPLSNFSIGDWAAASFALAIGGAICVALMFAVFWLLGMPGPKLWFGSGNIPADIIEVSVSLAIVTLFANLLGSFMTLGFFWFVRKVRR